MANLHLGRTQFGDPANAGNLLSATEALQLLEDWVPNERLRLHMLQVGALMKAWALEQENLSDTCVYCGKPAKKMVYWGRAY